MRNVFFFDTMITPKIITVLYWVMLVFTVLAGLGSIAAAFYSGSLVSFFVALFGTAIGLVLIRIWCELLIVLFKINSNLQKVADGTDKPNL